MSRLPLTSTEFQRRGSFHLSSLPCVSVVGEKSTHATIFLEGALLMAWHQGSMAPWCYLQGAKHFQETDALLYG